MPTITPQTLSSTVVTPGSTVQGVVSPEVKQENSSESPPSVQPQADVKANQLAMLARQEKAMRQHRRALEMERKALEAQKTEVEAAKAWQQKVKQGDLSFLNEAGVSQDQIVNYVLNGQKPVDPELAQMRKELQELRSAQQNANKAQEEQVTQVKAQLNQNVSAMIAAAPEEFEAIKAEGAQEAVVELMEQMNYTLDLREAAKWVEDFLVEQAYRVAGLKKVQAKFAPPVPEVTAEAGQRLQQVPVQSTLSNRQAASVPKRSTDRERKERAILAFQGKL